ncbi:hypothetical protein J6590_007204 [Homalodisca vitripennis]|nr:hypothetical protein J6590_007204 [Homalodisca vitripennis]
MAYTECGKQRFNLNNSPECLHLIRMLDLRQKKLTNKISYENKMYVRDVQSKTTDGSAVAKVLQESAATAWVDGNNALGPVVGNFCMDVAVKKAKDSGVGWVVAKGMTNFFLPDETH